MDKEQGNQAVDLDPFQAWADRLALEANMHQQTAIEVQQLSAEQIKTGLIALIEDRGALLQQLRDGLVLQQGEVGLLVIAQLASAGSLAQLSAIREVIVAVRGMSALKAAPQARVSLS